MRSPKTSRGFGLAIATLPLVFVAAEGAADTARAQMIAYAYPKDVPGFDTQAGVSVTSRIPAGYPVATASARCGVGAS